MGSGGQSPPPPDANRPAPIEEAEAARARSAGWVRMLDGLSRAASQTWDMSVLTLKMLGRMVIGRAVRVGPRPAVRRDQALRTTRR